MRSRMGLFMSDFLKERRSSILLNFALALVILLTSSDPGAAKQGVTARRQNAIEHFEEIAARAFFKLWLGMPVSFDWRGPCDARQVVKALQDKSNFPASLHAASPSGVNRRARYCRPVNAIIRDDQNTKFEVVFPKLDGCQGIIGEMERIIRSRSIDDLVVRPETYEHYGIREAARDRNPFHRRIDGDKVYREGVAAFILSKIVMIGRRETELHCIA